MVSCELVVAVSPEPEVTVSVTVKLPGLAKTFAGLASVEELPLPKVQ